MPMPCPLFLPPPLFRPPTRRPHPSCLPRPSLSLVPPAGPPVVVIGGGAAGFFAAITLACLAPTPVTILEASSTPLDKVRVSGGGRCNVTTSLDWYSPSLFAAHYPRGTCLLPSLLSRFAASDVVAFFEAEGVPLKVEPSGKVFPVSDTSSSVVDALLRAARRARVRLRTRARVVGLARDGPLFSVILRDGPALPARYVLVATGSASRPHAWAANLGHRVVPPVPSLFTFRVPDPALHALAGVSVPDVRVSLRLPPPRPASPRANTHAKRGPLLVTHWGLSGPAVLSLSAFAARDMHACRYRCTCVVDWGPQLSRHELVTALRAARTASRQKNVANAHPLPRGFPLRLWRYLVARAGVGPAQKWAAMSKESVERLADAVHACVFQVEGKGQFKEEFVTAGGVALQDVHAKTFESRKVDGLYFAGETLDVDGETGGYNLEFAWSSGYVAGTAIAERVLESQKLDAAVEMPVD